MAMPTHPVLSLEVVHTGCSQGSLAAVNQNTSTHYRRELEEII